jgi:hypothetical protein
MATIPCPGCGKAVHKRANECPNCGFRAESGNFRDLLASLSLISSILIGFGLASLVALYAQAPEAAEKVAIHQWAEGCWIFSSLLLLAVLVLSEWVGRQEISDTEILMPAADKEHVLQCCSDLLFAFLIALVFMAIGIVVLGFGFSPVHGGVAVVAVLGSLVLVWRVLRSRDRLSRDEE